MTTLVVIPGRREAASPESIITILEEPFGWSSFVGHAGVMDSGPAGFARVPE
jgi:hypothetical protein